MTRSTTHRIRSASGAARPAVAAPTAGRARRATASLATLAAAALALTACSLIGNGGTSGGGGTGNGSSDGAGSAGSPGASASEGGTNEGGGAAPSGITLVTHDSFSLSDGLLEEFTAETGIEVTQVAPGDGGALVNQLVLTAASPLGDVVFGVDNTFASRAIDAGVFDAYSSPALPASAEPYLLGEALTPIDFSDVCLNVDLAWYDANGQTPPATFDDLLKPEHAGQTVVTNPATSSPGLAFLLATISAFGEDGWVDYWTQLRANDLLVVDGWSDAYYVDFTGGGRETGTRPVVLSYASSPPFTIGDDGEATTAALLDTCFRQVEYAGVLAGASNPEGARAFIDFLLSPQVQADLPGSMYVFPIDDTVELPADWAAFAPLSPAPHVVEAAAITANRTEWIDAWTAAVLD